VEEGGSFAGGEESSSSDGLGELPALFLRLRAMAGGS
jgi:hypothetical protein